MDEAGDARLTPMRRLFERSKLVLGVIVAIALVIPLGAGLLDRLGFLRAEDRVLDELAGDDLDVALVASVLRVGGTRCAGAGSSSGTAFALDLDGQVLLLTNRHVVEGMRTVGLRRLDGSAGPRVAAWQLSASADVAVLRLEDGQPMPSALGLSPRPAEVGDDVRTVGFPDGMPYTTAGQVAAVEGSRLLLDVEVSGGASGSPLLDRSGRVVGQIFARTAEGRGVATVAGTVVAALDDLGEPRSDC